MGRMRVLLQRVREASVHSEGVLLGSIGSGLLIFWCATAGDGEEEIAYLAGKIARLRVFSDLAGKMNLSLLDIDGEALVVSQFTLYADTSRGNRPSFTAAAPPFVAIPLFESFLHRLSGELGKPVAAGRFGADMQVSLVNDGPVTVWLESGGKKD
jgi:D-aminoacyl-tRNA deacylase